MCCVCYGLYGLGIESQWGRAFRSRPDRPWYPPSLLYNGYRVCYPTIKRPGGGVLTTHPNLRPSFKSRAISVLPSGPSCLVLGWTLLFCMYRVRTCIINSSRRGSTRDDSSNQLWKVAKYQSVLQYRISPYKRLVIYGHSTLEVEEDTLFRNVGNDVLVDATSRAA